LMTYTRPLRRTMRLERCRPRNDFKELRTFIGIPALNCLRDGRQERRRFFGADHKGTLWRRQWRERPRRSVKGRKLKTGTGKMNCPPCRPSQVKKGQGGGGPGPGFRDRRCPGCEACRPHRPIARLTAFSCWLSARCWAGVM
jgi:hypothetical protein